MCSIIIYTEKQEDMGGQVIICTEKQEDRGGQLIYMDGSLMSHPVQLSPTGSTQFSRCGEIILKSPTPVNKIRIYTEKQDSNNDDTL